MALYTKARTIPQINLDKAQEALNHEFQHTSVLFLALSGIPGQIQHYDGAMMTLRRDECAEKGHNAMKAAINMKGANEGCDWREYAEKVMKSDNLAAIARGVGLQECVINPPPQMDDEFIANVLRACVHAVALDFDSTLRPSGTYGTCNKLGLLKGP